jgi:hypothetical protein
MKKNSFILSPAFYDPGIGMISKEILVSYVQKSILLF